MTTLKHEWYTVLRDHYTNAKTMQHADRDRWVNEVQAALHGKGTNDAELCAAIRWASSNEMRRDDAPSPSVSDLSKWVRHYRCRYQRNHGHAEPEAEGGVYVSDLSPEDKASIMAIYRAWRQEYGGNGDGPGPGKRLLDGGEWLEETDEALINGEWLTMGADALTSEGKKRRLVMYSVTRVRRAMTIADPK